MNVVRHALSSRRQFLQTSGILGLSYVLTSALPAIAQKGDSPTSILSDYMAGAASRELTAATSEAAKQHLLDTLAAMISGSQLAPGRSALNMAHDLTCDGTASVVGSKLICDPMEAALINAMLAHADETDDSHAPSQSHPGCAVIPAALAMAEKFDLDGERLLRAIVLGYDVGTRVGITLGGVDFQAQTHRDSHSHVAVFGAAAAAGSLASLGRQQMRWVLDYAGQQAAGLAAWQRDRDHIEKAFVFAGMPARNGVTAALVVHSGWTGIDDIFSGANNFLLANAPAADPTRLVEELGTRFEITRTNIKKWCVGSPIQAPLDAMEKLLQKNSFTTGEVKRITVRVATEEAVVVDNREMPDVCLQHMVALMLVDHEVTFQSAHDKSRMSDPEIQRQRSKVDLVRDELLERDLPRRKAIVEVELQQGGKYTERVDAVRGTAENRMTREEVIRKCEDLITPVMGKSRCSQLVEQVFAIERLKTIRTLRSLLQAT